MNIRKAEKSTWWNCWEVTGWSKIKRFIDYKIYVDIFFSRNEIEKIVEEIEKKSFNLIPFNTYCETIISLQNLPVLLQVNSRDKIINIISV